MPEFSWRDSTYDPYIEELERRRLINNTSFEELEKFRQEQLRKIQNVPYPHTPLKNDMFPTGGVVETANAFLDKMSQNDLLCHFMEVRKRLKDSYEIDFPEIFEMNDEEIKEYLAGIRQALSVKFSERSK